jgi:uncharacterized membrane protein
VVEDESVGKKRRWWLIPLGWLREESFYKDITTRALAAGIVALGAYFFALGAGYVSTPSGSQAAKGVLNVLGSITLAALAAWVGWFLHGKTDESPHRETYQHVLTYALLFIGLVVILLVIDAQVYPIPFWPFNTALFTY